MNLDLRSVVLNLNVTRGSTFATSVCFLGDLASPVPVDFEVFIEVYSEEGAKIDSWSRNLPIVEHVVNGAAISGFYIEYQGADTKLVDVEYLKYLAKAVYSDGAEQTLLQGNFVFWGI